MRTVVHVRTPGGLLSMSLDDRRPFERLCALLAHVPDGEAWAVPVVEESAAMNAPDEREDSA